MLKVAIIGTGWAGSRQVEAIRELSRKVTVECLVDNDPDHLQAKADELEVEKRYTNIQAALADPEVEAVSICLPHNLHCPVAIEAAAAKKHILCEKPMATTVENATRMMEAAELHNVKLYVAENLPYTSMSKFLRKLVQSGKYIGEMTFASLTAGFHALEYGYPGRRAWLSTPDLGGTGTWMLHGIHSMAQLRFILGEVETVYMQASKTGAFQRKDVEGTMSGLLTLESGVNVAVVQTAETHLHHNLGGYVIHGTQGSIRATKVGCEIYSQSHNEGQDPLYLNYPEEALSEYAQEIEAFADYVAGTAVGPTTAASERRSLAIVQAGYESAQNEEPINLKVRFGKL